MTNLLQETLEVLDRQGKTIDDIEYCQCLDGHFSVEIFKSLADNEYDSGYGAPEVGQDLILVGNDFWLSRAEYDGSEWWEFNRMPSKREIEITPKALIVTDPDQIGWVNVMEIK